MWYAAGTAASTTSAVEASATSSDTRSHDWNSGSRTTRTKFCGCHDTGRRRGGVIRSSASGFSAVSSITT